MTIHFSTLIAPTDATYRRLRPGFMSLATSCLMLPGTARHPQTCACAVCHLMRCSRVALGGMRFNRCHSLFGATAISHALDDVLGHLLGVAEQHHGVVAIEQG